MTPDNEARLEARVSVVEQRLGDLDRRVDGMAGMGIDLGVLRERVATIGDNLAGLGKSVGAVDIKVDALAKSITDRDDQAERDSRATRRWMVGLIVVLICALIGAAAVIATAQDQHYVVIPGTHSSATTTQGTTP